MRTNFPFSPNLSNLAKYEKNYSIISINTMIPVSFVDSSSSSIREVTTIINREKKSQVPSVFPFSRMIHRIRGEESKGKTRGGNRGWNVNSGSTTTCFVSARRHRKSPVLESLQDNGGRKHVI